jgi:ABC-type sugar transport system permease subunit
MKPRQQLQFFAVGALTATGAFLLLAVGQWQHDRLEVQVERAVGLARAVAWGVGASSGSEGLQALALEAPQKVEGVQGLLVLQGTRFVAHTDATRAGQGLDRDDARDKDLYDAAMRLKAVVGKNADERERNPELQRDAYSEYEVRDQQGLIVVGVPAVHDGHFAGLVELRARPVESPARLPWTFVLFAVVAIALYAGISRVLRDWALTAAGAVLLVITLAGQAGSLAAWRETVRLQHAGLVSTALCQLTSAGLLELAAPADAAPVAGEAAVRPAVMVAPAELVATLARGLDGSKGGSLVALRAATVAPASDRLASFGAAGFVADHDRAAFARAAQLDRSHLHQWAMGFALLALAGFLLGVLGQLRRFRDTLVAHRTAYGYLAPAMVGMVILVFIPMVFGLVIGFLERRYNVFEFAGLSNYMTILSDFEFTRAGNFYFKLLVTVLWTVLNVGLHVSIGLGLALLLNDQMLKARGIFRVLLIIPWAIPNYITALIWKGMFHKQFGAVNFFLAALGIEPIAWFQSFWPAFSTNLVTNTWLGFPFMMVISLGALQSIPGDLYEAAWVDGATRWHRFRYITLPLLMPALVPAVIVGVVWTFNMFNIIYLVSGGAPDGLTDILITDAYRWAFERDRYGYAAAYSTLIFLILLVFTTATNRITKATKGAYE